LLSVSLDCLVLFVFVFCTHCCQFLWIVLFYLCSFSVLIVVSFSGLSCFIGLRFLYPLVSVSLDCLVLFVFVFCTHCCQFLWIVLFYLSSFSVPIVVSFSGLSCFICVRFLYSLLSVSLDFLVLFVFVFCTHCCQFLWIVHSWIPLRFSELALNNNHSLTILFLFLYVYWCPMHVVLCFCVVFLRLVYTMLPASLGCVVFLCCFSSSCVHYVANISGLSFCDCPFCVF
jgi:hypothetical protein